MRTEQSIEVNVHYHGLNEEGKPEVLTGTKGRIIGAGLVLTADNEGFDVYSYDRHDHDANTVHVFQDNTALFSVGYLAGNEDTHARFTEMIGEGLGVVDWIRAAVLLNSEMGAK